MYCAMAGILDWTRMYGAVLCALVGGLVVQHDLGTCDGEAVQNERRAGRQWVTASNMSLGILGE